MKMRANLNRAVAGIGNLEFLRSPTHIRDHGTRRKKIFTWNHALLLASKQGHA
jgi:hypothetical protein